MSDTNGGLAPGITEGVVPVQIDIGAHLVLDTQPGTGVGVIMEVDPTGKWSIRLVCDTLKTFDSCAYDVYVSLPSGGLPFNVAGTNLGPQDSLIPESGGVYHLSTVTADSIQGMTFNAPVREPVQLEVYLDGIGQPQYVQWIGENEKHLGAPSDPVLFDPEVPKSTSSSTSTTHPGTGGSQPGTGGHGQGGGSEGGSAPGTGGAGGGTGGAGGAGSGTGGAGGSGTGGAGSGVGGAGSGAGSAGSGGATGAGGGAGGTGH